MPDLTPQLLPRLKEHQLPGLDLPSDFIAPKYDDQSILNIPASICHWMGIPEIGTPGTGAGVLTPEILSPLGNGVRRVILILIS